MKHLLLICAVVLVGCGKSKEEKAPSAEAKATAEAKSVEYWQTEGNAKLEKYFPEEFTLERAIREELKKPEGELTKADYEKVTELDLEDNQLTDVTGLEKFTQLESLNLHFNKLTDVKGLENLTQLKELDLRINPDLTKAQIDELQKALPNCKITHNAKK